MPNPPNVIHELRELLARYDALGGALGWTAGAVSGTIETTQADGVTGATAFLPLDEDKVADVIQGIVGAMWPEKYCRENARRILNCKGTELEIFEAKLAAAAVNALPELLRAPHTVLLTEISQALLWAGQHTAEKHANDSYPPAFAIRNHGSSGIGTNTAIWCETCDARKVSIENHHDITDYEAW